MWNVQGSWVHASKKQREKLLELIRRLAEDDKEGVMAHKVLVLLWNLAQSEDVTTDIMDQALAAHIKILDYSCSQVCSQVWDNYPFMSSIIVIWTVLCGCCSWYGAL